MHAAALTPDLPERLEGEAAHTAVNGQCAWEHCLPSASESVQSWISDLNLELQGGGRCQLASLSACLTWC